MDGKAHTQLTIEEAKEKLDAGHTLELDLPARDKYLAATYHALVNAQQQYSYSVFYPDVSVRWEVLFASTDWATFLAHLPTSLQTSAEWVVL